VLGIHDGELTPTLENWRKIMHSLSQWDVDIVISHGPWNQRPNQRYVGTLNQDAA
jgi:N-acetylglucosamine malate deacetylase 1